MIKYLVILFCCWTIIANGQQKVSVKQSPLNEISENDIYNFIDIVINMKKLDRQQSVDLKAPNHCNPSANDSTFLMQFLIDTSNAKYNETYADSLNSSYFYDIYDSISHKLSFGLRKDLEFFPEYVHSETDLLTIEDIDNILQQKGKFIDFNWDNSKLGFENSIERDWYVLSVPLFSKDRNKIIVMIERLCSGLCGNGETCLFINHEGIWEIITLDSWTH